MRSRELNKRVEVYTITGVTDGFGGQTTTPTLVKALWAKVVTYQAGKATNLADLGTITQQRSVLFTFRDNPNYTITGENHFLKYRNKTYTIGTAPTNINFEDNYVTFIGHES
jgi:head-tail adaptor